MADELDEQLEHVGRASADVGRSDRLYWRASLGQATYELLAARTAVTIDSLIAHLENTTRLDHLVLTNVSTRAAIGVLRSLDQHRNDPAP